MYLSFYGLDNEPFHVTPDPQYFFASTTHREALASIIYGVEKRKGFISLIGEVGTGKTTVVRAYMQDIEKAKIRTVLITNPNVSFDDLLRDILGEPNNQDPAHMLLIRLQKRLLKYYQQGYNFVVIIDEAQNMPDKTLEQLRMLSNLETNTTKLVQIALVGQPELGKKLSQYELRQMNQRIAVKANTRNLSRLESLGYIRHRLATAGQKPEQVFHDKSIKQIIKYAAGNPRVINILCDNLLVAGYGSQQKPISLSLTQEVIAEFSSDLKQSVQQRRKSWLPVSAAAGLVLFFGIYQTKVIPTDLRLTAESSALESYVGIEPGVDTKEDTSAEELTEVMSEPAVTVVDTVAVDAAAVDTAAVDAAAVDTAPVNTAPVDTMISDTYIDISAVNISNKTPSALADREETSTIINHTTEKPIPNRSFDQLAHTRQFPVVRTVKRGDELFDLCTQVYGFCDRKILRSIKTHNPHIRNIDVIFSNQRIIFPALKQSENVNQHNAYFNQDID